MYVLGNEAGNLSDLFRVIRDVAMNYSLRF
jgi:hypothetical protein